MFATRFRLPLVAGSGAGESFLMALFFSRLFLFLNGLLFFGRPFSRCGPCLFLSFDGFFQDLFLPEAPPFEDSIFLELLCFFGEAIMGICEDKVCGAACNQSCAA